MATTSQRLAVALAFLAGIISLGAAAAGYVKTGSINPTPLAGGLFMIGLGVSGLMRLRNPRR